MSSKKKETAHQKIVLAIIAGLFSIVTVIVGACATAYFTGFFDRPSQVDEAIVEQPTNMPASASIVEPEEEIQVTDQNNATSLPPPSIDILFQDDFSNDISGSWQIITGDWGIANGELIASAAGGQATIVAGNPEWTDYTVKVTYISEASRFAAVMVRVQDSNNYIQLLLGCYADFSSWQIVENGIATEVAGTTGPRVCYGYNLIEIRVENDTYTAFIEGETISFTKAIFSSGYVGLQALDYNATDFIGFDNFSVVE